MGGDKEESKFGFKDREKAEQTLRLLESEDPQYRRLTVRGLLGRARRVLSNTKAEDKIKNIKAAIAVFEEWSSKDKEATEEKKNASKANKKEKKESKKESKKEAHSDESTGEDVQSEEGKPEPKKADTVPGLGFKDAATARGTLAALEGRDPGYQKLAVKGLLGRAKRTLGGTRDEGKVSNIKEAVDILETALEAWERDGRRDYAYLPLETVLAASEKVEPPSDSLVARFVEAYKKAEGQYKQLRTVSAGSDQDGRTWDIVRNAQLNILNKTDASAKMSEEQHLELAVWAYSPSPEKLKTIVGDKTDRKRRSDRNDEEDVKKSRA